MPNWQPWHFKQTCLPVENSLCFTQLREQRGRAKSLLPFETGKSDQYLTQEALWNHRRVRHLTQVSLTYSCIRADICPTRDYTMSWHKIQSSDSVEAWTGCWLSGQITRARIHPIFPAANGALAPSPREAAQNKLFMLMRRINHLQSEVLGTLWNCRSFRRETRLPAGVIERNDACQTVRFAAHGWYLLSRYLNWCLP